MSPARVGAVELARELGLPQPTQEQVAVIEAEPSPLLVVAGAGSGKTETMAARVVWLVANGHVEPSGVLGLTFTRKAAGELALRVRRRLHALAARGLLPAPVGQAPGPPGRAAGGHGLVGAGPGTGGSAGTDPAAPLLGLGEATVSTYHAYAGAVLREHGLRLGIEPQARLLSQASAWQLAADVVAGWAGDMTGVDKAFATVVGAVLSLAGECAEHLVEPDQVVDFLTDLQARVLAVPDPPGRRNGGGPYAGVRTVLRALAARRAIVPVVAAYVEAKRARDALDYGDQIALAARLAREVEEVGQAERDRHRMVLLDEFQDTSHAQLVLLRGLFGGGHPVTAVGDPSQSIYGWRGASSGALQRFRDEFASADASPAPTLFLSTSWRNDLAILAAANLVSAPLRDGRLPVPELAARPDAGPGQVLAMRAETVEEEAAWVAARLAEVWRADEEVVARGGRRRSVAVLARARKQFEEMERALRAEGLPVEVVGLGGLLATPEVADIVATLQVLHDPTRGDALMRLLTGPRWRVGPRDLEGLARWARRLARARRGGAPGAGSDLAADADPDLAADADPDIVEQASIIEALDELPARPWRDHDGVGLSEEGHARLRRLGAELAGLRATGSVELADLVGEVEQALRLDIELAARPGQPAAAARAHLDAFAGVAAEFAESVERPTLGGFLAWLEAAEAHERGLEPGVVEVSSEAIQLLTVHAAKGLEWDVVAVPGLVVGLFPNGKDSDSGWLSGLDGLPWPLRGDSAELPTWDVEAASDHKDLDERRELFRAQAGEHELREERRLAYVAITRARSLLLLSSRVWADAKGGGKVSPFLTELLDAPVAVQVEPWAADGQGPNPRTAEPRTETWPLDPLGAHRGVLTTAAAQVREALARVGEVGLAPARGLAWATDIEVLLAERAASSAAVLDVVLPAHLSTSRLVGLAEDPAALAAQIRRPLPSPPRPAARRGTAFHAWLEQRFSAAAILDIDDLPGAADETASGEEDLEALKRTFLASEWAERVPVAVEVAFETPLGGLVLRGRADAVFAREGGGYDVVDWKSGRPPAGDQVWARAVQLAVYRLAWARLCAVPLERVGAAFFYAGSGETVRPVDLLDEAGLLGLLDALPRTEGG